MRKYLHFLHPHGHPYCLNPACPESTWRWVNVWQKSRTANRCISRWASSSISDLDQFFFLDMDCQWRQQHRRGMDQLVYWRGWKQTHLPYPLLISIIHNSHPDGISYQIIHGFPISNLNLPSSYWNMHRGVMQDPMMGVSATIAWCSRSQLLNNTYLASYSNHFLHIFDASFLSSS